MLLLNYLLFSVPFHSVSTGGNALHTSSLYVNFSSSKTCSDYSPLLPPSRDLLLQSCVVHALPGHFYGSVCLHPLCHSHNPIAGNSLCPSTPTPGTFSIVYASLPEWRDICQNLLAQTQYLWNAWKARKSHRSQPLGKLACFPPAISNSGKPLAHSLSSSQIPIDHKRKSCVLVTQCIHIFSDWRISPPDFSVW